MSTPTGDAPDAQIERLAQINQRIAQIKDELAALGSMRPGTLTQQVQDPKGSRRPYWQLSYTHRGKSHTDYIRDGLVDHVREQLSTYDRFKVLSDEWISLAIEHARLDMTIRRRNEPKRQATRTRRKT